jgi:hypothetical protein
MSKSTSAPAAPEEAAVPLNHRADAARAFLGTWLPQHGVAADAFSDEDAVALLVAIDAGAKAAA